MRKRITKADEILYDLNLIGYDTRYEEEIFTDTFSAFTKRELEATSPRQDEIREVEDEIERVVNELISLEED